MTQPFSNNIDINLFILALLLSKQEESEEHADEVLVKPDSRREDFISKAILTAQTNTVAYAKAFVESREGYCLERTAEDEGYLMQDNFEFFLNQSVREYDKLCKVKI